MELVSVCRGPVDRAMPQEVWQQDAYGVTEPPAVVLDVGAFTLLAAAWSDARGITCECEPESVVLRKENLREPGLESATGWAAGKPLPCPACTASWRICRAPLQLPHQRKPSSFPVAQPAS